MLVIKSRFTLACLLLIACCTGAYAQDSTYLTLHPQQGDGILSFLNRYDLLDSCNRKHFFEINNISKQNGLNLDRLYRLPIRVYEYNGTSIRTTVGIKDFNQAKIIEKYNDRLLTKGVKSGDFRSDKKLWVPHNIINCDSVLAITPDSLNTSLENTTPTPVETILFPLLGKEHEVVDIRSDKLKNHVYYLVSGHGGPDPGAIGKYRGHNLCEDEYAYDVTLRLANQLVRHGAKIYLIVQDENDGIRSDAVLPCDSDEVCYGGSKMPFNQLNRLKQRADVINRLYRKHKKEADKIQRVLIFHVDSRSTKQRVDLFFYHAFNSRSGKKLAQSLRQHIDEKYGQHQKNRGYNGTVAARNLYMLKKTLPTSVYVELGNIRNEKDQKRLILESNRQALANWFSEGIIKYETSNAD